MAYANVKLTPANNRTITKYGFVACVKALYLNEVVGEGPNVIGGCDARLGNNLINAGRAIEQAFADEAQIEEGVEVADAIAKGEY